MSTDIDRETMKRDLHGTEIGTRTEPTCDFCNAEIDTDEPVLSDVIRVEELPYVEDPSVLSCG